MKRIFLRIRLSIYVIVLLLSISIFSAALILFAPFAPNTVFFWVCRAAVNFNNQTKRWLALHTINSI